MLLTAPVLSAQIGNTDATPAVSDTTARSPGAAAPRRILAAEGVGNVRLYAKYLVETSGLSGDSIDRLLTVLARERQARLSPNGKIGMQLDPSGELAILAYKDDEAEQAFSTRLATPNLALADRAHTLSTALGLFTQMPIIASRVAHASRYMAQLDSMGDSAASWRFDAHLRMMTVYVSLNERQKIVSHFEAAVRLMPKVSIDQRLVLSLNGSMFSWAVDVLSGMPEGRARIDAAANAILAGSVPSQQEIDELDGIKRRSRTADSMFRRTVQLVSLVGYRAPAIVANYWYNMSPPQTDVPPETRTALDTGTPRSLPLDDGKIRLLEFGVFGCPMCRMAMPMMNRLHAMAPPGVEILYVTYTRGFWDFDLISPGREAAIMDSVYRKINNVKYPIALWAGAKHSNLVDGLVPQKSAAFEAFRVDATPTFVIVDGRGVIRKALYGYVDGLEAILFNALTSLRNDSLRTAGAASNNVNTSSQTSDRS